MKLLSWDTSSKVAALAAMEWDSSHVDPRSTLKLVSEWTLNIDATHSERLLWGLDELLEAARWKMEDVDVFGVGVGPGSFTGLRIGITTARTLAHAFHKPLVGVSSLAALIRPAAIHAATAASSSEVLVIAATDACKGELFSLWGRASAVLKSGSVQERVVRPGELVEELATLLGTKSVSQHPAVHHWLAVGEGTRRYLDFWQKLPQERKLEPGFPFVDHVQGRYLGLLAWEGFQAGLAREALEVHPRYLRASEAENKLRAGLLPPGPCRGI